MDCRECYELLPLYVDHNLAASEAAEIKRHLASCRACGLECSKLEATVSLVCGLDCVEPPKDFHQRFMARFNRECRPVRSWTIWGTMALSTAAAAAVVLLVVVLYNPLPQIPAPQPFAESLPAASAVPAGQGLSAPEKKMDAASKDTAKAKKAEPDLAAAESESQAAPSAPLASRSLARRAGRFDPLVTTVDFTPGASKSSAQPLRAQSAAADSAAAEPLVRTSGEWSGDACQVREPQQQVLRSPEALQAFWRSAGLTTLAVPEVDWRREMIGAICLGEMPTTGYDIELRELQRTAEALVVKYAVRSPQGPVASQVTQPFLIFRLPATYAPVRFVQE